MKASVNVELEMIAKARLEPGQTIDELISVVEKSGNVVKSVCEDGVIIGYAREKALVIGRE